MTLSIRVETHTGLLHAQLLADAGALACAAAYCAHAAEDCCEAERVALLLLPTATATSRRAKAGRPASDAEHSQLAHLRLRPLSAAVKVLQDRITGHGPAGSLKCDKTTAAPQAASRGSSRSSSLMGRIGGVLGDVARSVAAADTDEDQAFHATQPRQESAHLGQRAYGVFATRVRHFRSRPFGGLGAGLRTECTRPSR